MKDLFGASFRFSMEFDNEDEVRPNHDTEVCDCCGEEKVAIINIPFDFFATKEGDILFEPTDDMEADTIRAADGFVQNDEFIATIPHLSFSTIETDLDDVFPQLLTLADNILRQVDATDEYEAAIAGLEDGSINYDVEDAMEAGLSPRIAGITHPVLPNQARVCPNHGIKFSHDDLDQCCDEATITYNIEVDDGQQPNKINNQLKQQLREATSEHRTDLQNPYDNSGIIPTDALTPFLYKHGDHGITVWNSLHPHLFAEDDTIPHPILNPPENTANTLEQADISNAEYVEIVYDLFETLRLECPLTGTTKQEQMLKEQFPQLYQSTVGNKSVFEAVTPVWEDVVTQDELDGLSDTRTLYDSYYDVYRNGATYQYDEAALVDELDGRHIVVPANVFGTTYGGLDTDTDAFSLICSVEKTAHVPDINEDYFEGDPNIMLPKAAWITPKGIVLHENAQVSLSALQAAPRYMGSESDMEPLTDTVLQSASILDDDIPAGPQTPAFLDQLTFDPDSLDDNAATTTLGSHIDAIGDVAPVEDRDTIITPYNKRPLGVRINGEHWQTGLAISQFPVSHTTKQYEQVLEQDSYYISLSTNIYSPDSVDNDHLFHNPRAHWDAILHDDFDPSTADDPSDAIRTHVEASDYNAEDTMYMFQLSAPITTEPAVEITDLDL